MGKWKCHDNGRLFRYRLGFGTILVIGESPLAEEYNPEAYVYAFIGVGYAKESAEHNPDDSLL